MELSPWNTTSTFKYGLPKVYEREISTPTLRQPRKKSIRVQLQANTSQKTLPPKPPSTSSASQLEKPIASIPPIRHSPSPPSTSNTSSAITLRKRVKAKNTHIIFIVPAVQPNIKEKKENDEIIFLQDGYKIKQLLMKGAQIKGYSLIEDRELSVHGLEELKQLADLKIVSSEVLQANARLGEFIRKKQEEEKRVIKAKQLGISENERIQLLNNQLNEGKDLQLKVPSVASKLTAKQQKTLINSVNK